MMTDSELNKVGGAGFATNEVPILFNSKFQPVLDPGVLRQLRANASSSALAAPLNSDPTTLVIRGIEPGMTIRIGLQRTETIQIFGSQEDPFRKVNIPSR